MANAAESEEKTRLAAKCFVATRTVTTRLVTKRLVTMRPAAKRVRNL